MPAHKVAGQDFNKLWSDSIDISSGPFKFQSWQKGTQLTIVKNAAFKAGPQKAKVDRLVFRYIAGASQFQALKSGEGDVVEPQPQIQIVDFYKDKSFKVDAGSGYSWEHLDIQSGCEGASRAEEEVRPAGAHPGHQPCPDPRRALHQDRARRERQEPAGPPEQHLQAVRAALRDAVRQVEVQPEERHRAAEEERLHRRAGQADGRELEDLQLPGRWSALLRASPRRQATRFAR